MNGDESILLQRIAQRLDDHVDRYDRDRQEIKERVATDKKEQKEFRDGIIEKVENIEKKIEPVVNDHKMVMRVIKWTGAGGSVTLMAYLWDHLKDKLR